MDKTTKINEESWNDLVRSEVPCGRPNLKLTPSKARKYLDKFGILGDVKNKNVLCLASGGGQQSVGFALMGANVTVVDFSEEQLRKDALASNKLSLNIRTVKSDMRDLSMFKDSEFDIVYQPYSINYICKTDEVFDEVKRVLKKSGIYHLMFHNPYVHGSWQDGCWGSKWDKKDLWQGKGYPIWQPYIDGYPIKTNDQHWNFEKLNGEKVSLPSPQEFKHTLSTVINGLISRDFKLLLFKEYQGKDFIAPVGTWDHYISVVPPWFFLWLSKEK